MADAERFSEVWLPVVGYEGLYEVSDQGRVRSLPRRVPTWHGSRVSPGRVLKTPPAGGYPRAHLSKGGVAESVHVHRLVLEAFVGPCPTGQETLHRDGDRGNCRLSNLRWGTQAENRADSLRHDTHVRNAKLSAEKVERLRRDYHTMSQKAWAGIFGVTREAIRNAVSGRAWNG